jgi:voltage-gated sodium channel
MHIVSQFWFEVFVLANILLVGAATGVDLENNGRDEWTRDAVAGVSTVTLTVFTLEVILKVIAEGLQPWHYFIDEDNGPFNTFDFLIVVASYALLGGSSAGALGILRMLRLVRLLTFIKNVPVLRVIIVGLIQGMKSVTYIVMLLFLVIYLFAILGCLIFGENDPNHFGAVHIAMIALFQVSTLASWTSIAYVSWYGCENYIGSPYGEDNPTTIST